MFRTWILYIFFGTGQGIYVILFMAHWIDGVTTPTKREENCPRWYGYGLYLVNVFRGVADYCISCLIVWSRYRTYKNDKWKRIQESHTLFTHTFFLSLSRTNKKKHTVQNIYIEQRVKENFNEINQTRERGKEMQKQNREKKYNRKTQYRHTAIMNTSCTTNRIKTASAAIISMCLIVGLALENFEIGEKK